MKTILFISTVWPKPNATAAGVRIVQLIDSFLKENYSVHFAATSQVDCSKNALEKQGIQTHSIAVNEDTFDDLILQINPNIVLFDRFISEEQFGWRIDKHCPYALKILDTEDIHGLREARKLAFKKQEKIAQKHFQNNVLLREIASIYRCDLSLIISNFEYQWLQDEIQIPPHLLYYLPFLNHSEENTNGIKSFHEREDFFTIGNFLHEPNWESVLQLKNNIWPKLRKRIPKAKLYIYGAYVTQKAKQLHNPNEGFIIHGAVHETKTVFQNHKIILAPLPYGAGLKGKLFESLQFRVPSITTPIGAEGLQKDDIWPGFVTTDDTEFIEKAHLLYENQSLWEQKQKNALILLKSFDEKIHLKSFHDKITKTWHELENHRTRNLLTSVFKHHFMKSSFYMSQWIQLKNAIRE